MNYEYKNLQIRAIFYKDLRVNSDILSRIKIRLGDRVVSSSPVLHKASDVTLILQGRIP